MEQKGFIKYIVIIAVILLVAFFSQQAYYWGADKTIVSGSTDQANTYLANASAWVNSKIYPKVTGEVKKRGDIIKKEVSQEKQKISENIVTKIENYFAGVTNSVMHPGTPQNCQMSNSSSGE